ncbi:hypothetical protein TIFTF001_051438 [Ficus carica]|uniref:Uncharacterized protein n=1 Tax=Ficus carica TaxID=3494 RepID=A0AA88CP18_FICCA|nr:hypothetical protein TIFTF001_051438 [Ficus carica]
MLGIYMQRSWIYLTSHLPLPLATLHLRHARAGPEAARPRRADSRSRRRIHGPNNPSAVLSLAINFPAQKFLQAQLKVNVLAWIAVVAFVECFGSSFFVFSWGTSRVAWAFDITRWATAAAQLSTLWAGVRLVGWASMVFLQGYLGLCQAFPCLSRYTLPRDSHKDFG